MLSTFSCLRHLRNVRIVGVFEQVVKKYLNELDLIKWLFSIDSHTRPSLNQESGMILYSLIPEISIGSRPCLFNLRTGVSLALS